MLIEKLFKGLEETEGGVLLSEALRVPIEALRVCRGSESVYVASIAIIKLYYTCTMYCTLPLNLTNLLLILECII